MAAAMRISRIAFWSIPIGLAVLASKVGAAWITGSAALFADALESVINVLAACIAWWAIRIAQLPADANHPFGHHKAEYFAAVLEGVLIVVATLAIFREAALTLLEAAPVAAPVPGLALIGVATAVNAVWAAVLIRAGRRHRSPALAADGRHLRIDVISSLGVMAGLALALATGWVVLDALLAFAVGLNVLYEGWRLVQASIGGLMDAAVEPEEAGHIARTIRSRAAGAIEIHDIRARRAGPALFVEFHLVVDGAMDVRRSHGICDRIESGLRAEFPGAHVTIHVEPRDKGKARGPGVVPVAAAPLSHAAGLSREPGAR